MTNVYSWLGRNLSIKEADATLEQIAKSARISTFTASDKTTQQLNNSIKLNNYRKDHPVKAFLKGLYYHLTDQI